MAGKRPLCIYTGEVKELQSGDTLPVPTTITVANEATDTTCYLLFVTGATGDLAPKTNTNLSYNSNTGELGIGCVPNELLSVNNPYAVLGTLYPIVISQSGTTTLGGLYAVPDGAELNGPCGLSLQTFKTSVGIYDAVRVSSDGNVGLGKIPSYLLDLLSTGDARKTGTHWVDLSDATLKENISTIPNALDIITQLRGVTFQWKDNEKQGEKEKKTHIGLIAQEVEKVIPSWVTTDKEGYKNTCIGNDTALFIQAFKEQKAIIDGLMKRIELLENK